MYLLRRFFSGSFQLKVVEVHPYSLMNVGRQPTVSTGNRSATYLQLQAGRKWLVVGLVGWIIAATSAGGADAGRSNIVLAGRTVLQDQGAWVVEYRLRYTGQGGIIITPDETACKLEGWVSNSRVASHTTPRWSSLAVVRGQEWLGASEVIAAVDEAHRCKERLAVSIWVEESGSPTAAPGAQDTTTGTAVEPNAGQPQAVSPVVSVIPGLLSMGPGAILRVRLRLEHHHILYGDYDPLLGVRSVELTLGGSVVRDVVPLDREQYLAQPKFAWPEPPELRRDTHHSVSGPDSLHLEAHIPGHQYYRYPERPVRYNTKMRLRFWYLIAAGTEGECRVRFAQFKDTPISWRMLDNGGFEQVLKKVGRWTKVERMIQTEPEATIVTLEFKIVGDTDVGEMWVDDVSLEPISCTAPERP
jgi:hypothetical protein